jgi:hypothetical protein
MSESLNRKRQIQEYKTQQPVIDKSAAIHTCTPPQDEYMTLKEKVNLAMAWYDSGLEDRATFQTLMESILEQLPQRTWVGLTDEDFQPMVYKAMMYYGYDPKHSTLTSGAGFYELARAIENKLKQKNSFAEEKNI